MRVANREQVPGGLVLILATDVIHEGTLTVTGGAGGSAGTGGVSAGTTTKGGNGGDGVAGAAGGNGVAKCLAANR